MRIEILLLLSLFLSLFTSCTEPQSHAIAKPQVQEKPIQSDIAVNYPTGKITTIADGYDVGHVNLWSSSGSTRKVIGRLNSGEPVSILEDADPYYKIKVQGKVGFLAKGFVILD
jgi:hypothetical protein